ncbi:MAG: SufE family protein [Rickettsiales bacterium]|jgi:cysteine desulfuration protein SufE|nr:SufE family protein [Rickettsiales bacterium]
MSLLTNETNKIIEEFSLFEDWEDKYSYIIDLGKKLSPLDDKYKTDHNMVVGCSSQVWLISHKDNYHKYFFLADSDAYIVKGLIAILLRIFSGKTAEEIQNINIEDFFLSLGLKQHLSPNRSNGFFAMVNKIKKLTQ